MAESTLITFVELLRKSGLLTPSQSEKLNELQPRFPDANGLAKELIRRGWVTAFQVNQVSKGKGQDLVLGNYLILERLGEGGMGMVFKAKHRSLGRVVALKVVRKDRLSNPNAIRRFQREIQAAGKLSHGNVVIAYDADEINGTHFYAMEYVEGVDLSRLVKQNGPLPVAQACNYIYQAALALQHAHEQGMVHRDIKPHNFLLSQEAKGKGWGTVKILDMGLARLGQDEFDERQSTLTHDGKVVGTPDYIAPEQARNSHTADIRADLYSLGCTFYFLLTGRVPFPGGDSMMEKLMKHQMDEPVPFETYRPDVPPAIRDIVLKKLITKRPEDRFQVPAELAAALEPYAFKSGTGSSTAFQAGVPIGNGGMSGSMTAVSNAPTVFETSTSGSGGSKGGSGRLFVLPFRMLGWLIVLLFRPGPRSSRRILRLALMTLLLGAGGWIGVTMFMTGGRKPGDAGSGGGTSSGPLRLDLLDAAQIPAELRLPQQPKELVALHGEPRGRHWGPLYSQFGQAITRVVYSGDGRLLASVSAFPSSTVHVWDAQTLRELTSMRSSDNYVSTIGFSGDARTLTMVGTTGQVQVWDTSDKKMGTLIKSYNIAQPRGLALSPDGKHLGVFFMSADGKTKSLQVLDAATGTVRHTIPVSGRHVSFLAFSADSKLFAATIQEQDARNHTLKVWEIEPLLKERASVGNLQFLMAMPVFSPDSKQVAVLTRNIGGGAAGAGLKLVNTENGQQTQVLNELGNANAFALAPDFKTLAVSGWTMGGTFQVSLWDLDRKNVRHKLPDSSGPIGAMMMSPDSKTLATSNQNSGVKLWNVDLGKERVALKGASHANTMAFSPDSKTFVTGGTDMTLHCWNVRSGDEVPALKPRNMPVTCLALLDGRVAIGTGEIDAGKINSVLKLWDPAADKDEVLIRDRSGAAGYWDYDPRQKLFATASFLVEGGNTVPVVKLWSVDGKEQNPLGPLPPRGTISCLAFSADGKYLAAGSHNNQFQGGSFIWWDLATSKESGTVKVAKGQAQGVAFSPDGKVLATLTGTNQDASVKLFDLATTNANPLPEVSGMTTHVISMAFAPSGNLIATGASQTKEDRTVILWDYTTGKEVKTLSAHKTQVQALAFATDGKWLASSSTDGQLIVWNTSSGAVLQQWTLPGPALRLRFADDGRHLLVGNANGTVAVFRLSAETAGK